MLLLFFWDALPCHRCSITIERCRCVRVPLSPGDDASRTSLMICRRWWNLWKCHSLRPIIKHMLNSRIIFHGFFSGVCVCVANANHNSMVPDFHIVHFYPVMYVSWTALQCTARWMHDRQMVNVNIWKRFSLFLVVWMELQRWFTRAHDSRMDFKHGIWLFLYWAE